MSPSPVPKVVDALFVGVSSETGRADVGCGIVREAENVEYDLPSLIVTALPLDRIRSRRRPILR